MCPLNSLLATGTAVDYSPSPLFFPEPRVHRVTLACSLLLAYRLRPAHARQVRTHEAADGIAPPLALASSPASLSLPLVGPTTPFGPQRKDGTTTPWSRRGAKCTHCMYVPGYPSLYSTTHDFSCTADLYASHTLFSSEVVVSIDIASNTSARSPYLSASRNAPESVNWQQGLAQFTANESSPVRIRCVFTHQRKNTSCRPAPARRCSVTPRTKHHLNPNPTYQHLTPSH